MPPPSPALTLLADRMHVPADRIAHLDRLDEAMLGEFAELLGRAQERDGTEIEEALQQTLRFVPRLLRGRAQKILFPEDHG